MPPRPPDEVLDNALDDLLQMSVDSFTATPASIGPFGESELHWEVSGPPTVQLRLNGRSVPRKGSQTVRPLETRSYALVGAAVGGLHAELARLTLPVDLSACMTFSVDQASIEQALLRVVQGYLDDHPKASTRKPPEIAVTPSGIELKLRFEIEVDNSFDPDFDVDALIGLHLIDGAIEPYYREYSADLDFEWWQDAINSLGGPILAFVIAFYENNAQSEAQRKILEGIRDEIAVFSAALPSGWAPHQVVMGDGEIVVRSCPLPGATGVTRFLHPDFAAVAWRKAGCD